MSEVLEQTAESWPEVVVSDVSELIRGVTYSKEHATDKPQNGYTPVLRATNIQESRLVLESDLVFVPDGNVSAIQRLRAGDIVVATSSGSKHLVGKSGLVHADWRGSFGAFCAAIRPKANIEPRFLAAFLQSPSYWKQVGKKALGVNINNLRRGDIESLTLPLPPLEKQREIVAELEKQFSRLDEAVANLQRVKAKLKRYKASVLKAAVEGRLVETVGGWRQAKLGEIALSVRNGYSHKPDAESGTRIFRISAVRPMELAADDVRYLSGSSADYDTFLTIAGDVLFTRYNGSRDYVGVCAVVPAGLPSTAYPDKLIRVRVPHDQLLPAFLVIAASKGAGREFIESMIRTTAGQSGVSGTDIKAIPLSIPSLDEQKRIVAEVDRHLSIVREVEAEVDTNLQRAQTLRQATLAKAFGHESV